MLSFSSFPGPPSFDPRHHRYEGYPGKPQVPGATEKRGRFQRDKVAYLAAVLLDPYMILKKTFCFEGIKPLSHCRKTFSRRSKDRQERTWVVSTHKKFYPHKREIKRVSLVLRTTRSSLKLLCSFSIGFVGVGRLVLFAVFVGSRWFKALVAFLTSGVG